jgi:y4mF family transcriptional regulator
MFPYGNMIVHSTSELGRVVRDSRKAKGLRQAELALAAGTGRRFVVELEQGKPTVQLDRVIRVLQALGLSIDLQPRKSSSAWLQLS